MADKQTPHPLDLDYEGLADSAQPRQSPPQRPRQPLLRPSLWVAVLALIVLFAASVAAIVGPPGSAMSSAAQVTSRLSGLVMVVALVGVLASYRLASFQTPVARPRKKRARRVSTGLGGLVLMNVVGLSLAIVGVALLGNLFGGLSLLLLWGAMMVWTGLLATMSVWHTSYVRAYAIGSLTTMGFGLLPLSNMVALLGFGGRGFPWDAMAGAGLMHPVIIVGASVMTFAVVTGLCCAFYVQLLTNQPAAEPPADESLDQS